MERLSPTRATELASELLQNIERVFHGKADVALRVVVSLVARGHVLLEDVPGVGKTTLSRSLARSIDGEFHRIQFTSDLLPSDITGVSLPEMHEGRPSAQFRFQPGPVFGNVVLADEVNRANPKCQSALLEAMAEGTVSVDGTTHALPDPFFVIATQNPLEHYGTHPLPESQLDRFLMRLSIGYPTREFEAQRAARGSRRQRARRARAGGRPGRAAVDAADRARDQVRGLARRLPARSRRGDARARDARARRLAARRRRAAQAPPRPAPWSTVATTASPKTCGSSLPTSSPTASRSTRAAACAPGPRRRRWLIEEILDRVPVPL